MSHLFATFFYVGLMPKAPGTWGSLAALPVALILFALGGFSLLLIATIAVFFIGWWATAAETRGKADHDPGEIVIDEVAGQWVTLLPFAYLISQHDSQISLLPWPGILAGFILFRLFDIFKPGPVGWADRMGTPLGVMLDDIVAGIFAAGTLLAIGAAFHRLLL